MTSSLKLVDEPQRERQRFTLIHEMQMEIPFRVVVAVDKAFQDTTVCIVSLPIERSMLMWLKQSLMAHCSLYHPHVLKFYDVFLSAEATHVVFEYPNGRNLLSILQKHKLKETQARHLFQQITFAVAYYHSMNLSGLDLELENIFLDTETGLVKIVDFGFWKMDRNCQVRSLAYLPPEELHSPLGKVQTSPQKTDVWSLGVLLYTMLFQTFPFAPTQSASQKEHLMNIMRVNWSIPPGEILSTECHDLLKKIFTPKKSERITMQGIMDHPWYLKNLPSGVQDYRSVERPQDGLLEKVRRLEEMITI